MLYQEIIKYHKSIENDETIIERKEKRGHTSHYQILKCYDTIIKSRTNSNQDLLFQLMRQLTLQLIMTKNMVELETLKDTSYQTRCMALHNTSF